MFNQTKKAGDMTNASTSRMPLRLWPGVIAVAVQWFAMFVLPLFMPETGGTAILVGVALGLIVILWWLFFSRAPWHERVAAIVLMPLAAIAVKQVIHLSIANAGRGYMFYIYSIPLMCLGLVVWATTTRNLSPTLRRAALPIAILLACGVLALVRTNGVWGDAKLDFAWRWSATAEEKLLAQSLNETPLLPPTPTATVIPATQPLAKTVAESPSTSTTKKIVDEQKATQAFNEPMPPQAEAPLVEWSGFRGAERDGIVHGVRINTDWSSSPPQEIWRRPIGPAWSSFAVRGNRFFTQEQRGEEELVVCYDLNTGEPIWRHSDSTRFWESNAGAGPRATPTLHHERVYTFGGTGIMNALNAEDGAVVWSRNVVADAKVKVPYWGCAASPLVVDTLVIIAAAGRLVAYDLASGSPRWFGPDSGWGYGSPQLLTIAGLAQIVLINGLGVIGVAPSDGTLLWEHKWPGDGILQPTLTADGDLLLGSGSGLNEAVGMRRLAITQSSGAWKVEERWTTNALKPYYSDVVIHKGHAFGFDGSILACIDLNDGKRKWKGGRYGHGQLFLLPEQDVMLVLTESGELALVAASSEQFTELARFPAIKGKTWNHPVLAGDILLVRNGEEMVAFRLSLAQS